MREYYRAQLVDLGKRFLIGVAAGAAIGLVVGAMMEEIAVCMIMFSFIGGCFPQGIRISARVDNILPGILILPLIGWVILWGIKLAVIIYGGLFATPVLAVYYAVRMKTCAKEA